MLTPNKYDYQYLPEVPVSNKRMISFSVRAQADVHIALSSVYAVTDVDTYEIGIGAAGNTKSFIRFVVICMCVCVCVCVSNTRTHARTHTHRYTHIHG